MTSFVRCFLFGFLLFSVLRIETITALEEPDIDECEDEDDPDVCPFDENVPVRNVALGRPATQSTNYIWGFPAALAVDGNRDGWFWESKTCSHTSDDGEPFPWLQVDLGDRYLVKSVSIYTRMDPCCNDRYHDIEVRVGMNNERTRGIFYQNGLCNTIGKEVHEPGYVFNLTCKPCLAGRYVSIQIVDFCKNCQNPDFNILHVCEFEIFGAKV